MTTFGTEHAMAERPRTRRASLAAISRLAPLRNSVTSPVERVTSAASSGACSKTAQYFLRIPACRLSAPSRMTTAPSPALWYCRQSAESAARHTGALEPILAGTTAGEDDQAAHGLGRQLRAPGAFSLGPASAGLFFVSKHWEPSPAFPDLLWCGRTELSASNNWYGLKPRPPARRAGLSRPQQGPDPNNCQVFWPPLHFCGTTSEKCEAAHRCHPIIPHKTEDQDRYQDGSPNKPKPARFASVFWMVLAMAAIILAITTRDLAAPSASPIYRPQLVLVY